MADALGTLFLSSIELPSFANAATAIESFYASYTCSRPYTFSFSQYNFIIVYIAEILQGNYTSTSRSTALYPAPLTLTPSIAMASRTYFAGINSNGTEDSSDWGNYYATWQASNGTLTINTDSRETTASTETVVRGCIFAF